MQLHCVCVHEPRERAGRRGMCIYAVCVHAYAHACLGHVLLAYMYMCMHMCMSVCICMQHAHAYLGDVLHGERRVVQKLCGGRVDTHWVVGRG